ncbi:MAG: biosynthetic-type acetolactate synthase large subunit [Clostridium sp.]|uniref:biosynthetic-type acetolactate synthase large subunit n=1 Tax=Clostridium sp. DSM 8431 TaxID=1761781 RepID=UPI0008F3C413|nr:biosynthetic-type acetolactate synthase large subunit [Clostridium sp. DSM 8431]MCR4942920.1 biosynthetic-type acetolactate synthase large subunit [Clostridium sp.]SFU73839.1 acetolactate synthase, large subunit [Clostridium sp. DSM 8431]
MLLSGSDIVIKSLIDEGTKIVFGYPGGQVINIYDSLYKYQDEIKHVLTCHEQNAAHAADGYARATGEVGVCIATSGPGATNLVTGIATAYMDSIPLVAITGNVPMNLLGKDSFQEVDITGITMPITKHNYIVKDVNKLQEVIKDAFRIAKEGRPGPVLIDIPKNIQIEKTEYKELAKTEPKKVKIRKDKINEAIAMINKAKKPFIYVGGGAVASNASEQVLALAEKIDSPICNSLMARGVVPSDHPLYTGMIGMHGTKASNITATKCDLFIALGARFSDRVISNPENLSNANIIHIDIDPAEINKNVKVDLSITADLKDALEVIVSGVDEKNNETWIENMNSLKRLPAYKAEGEDVLSPKVLFDALNKVTDKELIISTEVGQHQMWTAQYYNFKKPRTLITSGGLGTMGFGLGASIGAQFGKPNCKVINIAGDGSFMMNCQELATAVTNKLPLVVIVMNNNVLGMVRQWQTLFFDKRYSNTTLNRKTNLVKLAEAFGAEGYMVREKEDLDDVLEKALNAEGPVLIDYRIDSNKNVFPMVAPGAPINQIITESDLD